VELVGQEFPLAHATTEHSLGQEDPAGQVGGAVDPVRQGRQATMMAVVGQ
jgi:hypothetical protein